MHTETNENENWKMKTLLIGAILGTLAGLGSAYLLIRTADESRGEPPKIGTRDAIKAGIGVIGVMRGIASLGDNN